MKREEQIVKSYLEFIGEYSIEYEPDGNIPPDFVINNETAIEVRRLNQNILINNKLMPIEDLEFSLIPKLQRIFKQIENDSYDKSIFVSVRYRRPLAASAKLMREVKSKVLDSIQMLDKELLIEINNCLHLKLFRSSLKLDNYISIGAISDMDTGGFVVDLMRKNILVAVSEKEFKVKPYLNLYKYWWLILVDQIGFLLEEYDFEQLNAALRLKSLFNKIIVVSSLDHKKAHELIIN